MDINKIVPFLRLFILYQTLLIVMTGSPCGLRCSNCSNSDGCLKCRFGTFGEHCQHDCNLDILTCHRCSFPSLRMTECHRCQSHEYYSVGRCINCPTKCMSCFNSSTCEKCSPGYFGQDCSKSCHITCKHCSSEENKCIECDQYSGKCTRCTSGTYGPYCNKICDHCMPNKEGHLECNISTGKCPAGCLDGYYGQRCNKICGKGCLPNVLGIAKCEIDTGKCASCSKMFYGIRCDKKCRYCVSHSKNGSPCDPMTGYCYACVDGFYGDRCNKRCKSSCFYSKYIKRKCDKQTGKCLFKCRAGMYGKFCDTPCSSACLRQSCNQLSGTCDIGCIDGWYGDTCEKKCSLTCYDRSCDQETGYCDHGCASEEMEGPLCNNTKDFKEQLNIVHIGTIGGSAIILILIVGLTFSWLVERYLQRRTERTESENTDSVYDEIEVMETTFTEPKPANTTDIPDETSMYHLPFQANASLSRHTSMSTLQVRGEEYNNILVDEDVYAKNNGFEQPVESVKVDINTVPMVTQSSVDSVNKIEIYATVTDACNTNIVTPHSGMNTEILTEEEYTIDEFGISCSENYINPIYEHFRSEHVYSSVRDSSNVVEGASEDVSPQTNDGTVHDDTYIHPIS